MGIASILTAAVKHISWDQVANIAMQYGPDFVRKLKERMQSPSPAESEAAATADQLGERIRELESALIKQEEIIQQQNNRIELLEQNGKTLQARLQIFMALSAVSVLLSIAVFILLMGK